jgi:hypothetical protein
LLQISIEIAFRLLKALLRVISFTIMGFLYSPISFPMKIHAFRSKRCKIRYWIINVQLSCIWTL